MIRPAPTREPFWAGKLPPPEPTLNSSISTTKRCPPIVTGIAIWGMLSVSQVR